MKKICFYDLPFVRHDKNAPSEGKLRRILAGDKVFYTNSKQFADAQVLNHLVAGDRIYIGAHQLADGSYWLHWLVAPEKGSLQPTLADINKPAALLKLIAAVLIMVLSAFGYFQVPNIWIMLPLLFVFVFGCWWFVVSLHRLLVGTSSSTRRLLRGLDRVKQGDTSLCRTPMALLTGPRSGALSLQANSERDNDLDTLQPQDFLQADKVALTSVSGEAANVSARRGYTGSGKSRRDFVEYQFSCNGVGYLLRSGFNSMTEGLSPLFYRQHPFFLADGDPLMLVVNQQDNALLGLCNERDGSAYLKLGGIYVSFQQIKFMYKVILGCCSLLLVMPLFFILHDWWEQGAMPDRWDWLDAAGTFYDFGLMSILFFCLFMLAVEVCSWVVRRNSLSALRYVFARQLLVLCKKRRGEKTYIQEVA